MQWAADGGLRTKKNTGRGENSWLHFRLWFKAKRIPLANTGFLTFSLFWKGKFWKKTLGWLFEGYNFKRLRGCACRGFWVVKSLPTRHRCCTFLFFTNLKCSCAIKLLYQIRKSLEVSVSGIKSTQLCCSSNSFNKNSWLWLLWQSDYTDWMCELKSEHMKMY